MSKCADCSHCIVKKAEILAGQSKDTSQCRRYPPVATILLVPAGGGQVAPAGMTAWPNVEPTDLCGEFRAKVSPFKLN